MRYLSEFIDKKNKERLELFNKSYPFYVQELIRETARVTVEALRPDLETDVSKQLDSIYYGVKYEVAREFDRRAKEWLKKE